MDRRGKKRRAGFLPVMLVCVAVLLLGVFFMGSYPADETALAVLAAPPEGVTVEIGRGRIVFRPEEPELGLIFYPGGRVRPEAYAPLMAELAERGVLCVVPRMPGDLAVLMPNAADGVQAAYPEVGRWLIGGHSLGGVIAAHYAEKHADAFEGLVLLAAYSDRDLRDSGLRVLSVVGTEDGVLKREAYAAGKALLPEDAQELVIEGGCHALFGSYGAQRGDGVPTITGAEQRRLTEEAVTAMSLAGDEPQAA